MAITRVNEFHTFKDKIFEMEATLKLARAHIIQSEGCKGCYILQDEEVIEKFIVIEVWDSKEAHQASVETFPKEQMQAAASLFYKAPKAQYFNMV